MRYKGFFVVMLSFALMMCDRLAIAQSEQIVQLSKWLKGSFTNQDQYYEDSINYYNVRMDITPIWTYDKNGYWFYVEQSHAGYESKPYRQRVYHLTEPSKGVFQIDVFTLKLALRFAQYAVLVENTQAPDSLTLKKGCSMILKSDNEESPTYIGGTIGNECSIDRLNTKYATTEISVSDGQIKIWERGYGYKDEQVYGPTVGPFVYSRKF